MQLAFYSQNFGANQKNIFIIGSSQIQALNPNFIREDLLKNNQDYHVYNLGIATDLPKSRLKTVDWIISSKPAIVVYGISDRDFEIRGAEASIENQVNYLPDPHDVIEEWLYAPLINFQDQFYFLQSPKLDFLTLTFGGNSTGMNIRHGFAPDPHRYAIYIENQNWPIANDTTLEAEGPQYPLHKILPLEKNANFIAFQEIVNKLRGNKIHLIIFIIPQEHHRLEKLHDVEPFNLVLEKLSQQYHDVPIYSLWDKYADLHIWQDPGHVVMNTKKTTRIYSDDVAKMIDGKFSPSIATYVQNTTITAGHSSMQDTTVTAGYGTYAGKQINAEYVSNSSGLVGDQIDTIILNLKKVGAPTGTATIGVFNYGAPSVRQVFATIDVSTISTSYTDYTFSLPTSSPFYKIQAGDRIGIKYGGGDSSNFVGTTIDGSNGFDGTNSYYTYYASSWQSSKTSDLTMILKLVNNSGNTKEGNPDLLGEH